MADINETNAKVLNYQLQAHVDMQFDERTVQQLYEDPTQYAGINLVPNPDEHAHDRLVLVYVALPKDMDHEDISTLCTNVEMYIRACATTRQRGHD